MVKRRGKVDAVRVASWVVRRETGGERKNVGLGRLGKGREESGREGEGRRDGV